MGLKVDYVEIMDTITKGLVAYNKNEILGKMLLQRRTNIHELQDKEELEEQIRFSVHQDAFAILVQLKLKFDKEFQVFEEGVEILTEYNKNDKE